MRRQRHGVRSQSDGRTYHFGVPDLLAVAVADVCSNRKPFGKPVSEPFFRPVAAPLFSPERGAKQQSVVVAERGALFSPERDALFSPERGAKRRPVVSAKQRAHGPPVQRAQPGPVRGSECGALVSADQLAYCCSDAAPDTKPLAAPELDAFKLTLVASELGPYAEPLRFPVRDPDHATEPSAVPGPNDVSAVADPVPGAVAVPEHVVRRG